MFARLRRPLRRAALAAVAASLLLTPLALADGEWCQDEPALVVNGQEVSITLVPHVPKADANQVLGAETVLRAPIDSHTQLVPTSGQHDFPDHTYLVPSTSAHGGPVSIDAVSVVTTTRAGVPTEVQIVIVDPAKGTSTSWTVMGQTNQPIHYTINVS